MSSEKNTTIKLMPNGPYVVNNINKLSNIKGAIDADETVALCRCGASANKPFCDGSHVKIGFNSDKNDDRREDKKETYIGNDITIYDNRGICAHAGVCTDNLATVFRMKPEVTEDEPWIDPDAETIEKIITIIKKCPSGALSYSLNSNNDDASNNDVSTTDISSNDRSSESTTPTVMVAPNGPYVVAGCVDINDITWGSGAEKQQFTLCRCGASKNKPFCDGSHWSINFTDDKN
jgi:CDGSH-type Zn-finger protein